MNTLDYILKKINIVFDRKTPMPLEIPNFGRDNLASLFEELKFKIGAEIVVSRDLPHHDGKLILGWKPKVTIAEGIQKTVEWVKANPDRLRPLGSTLA